jgi:hypothetical protein
MQATSSMAGPEEESVVSDYKLMMLTNARPGREADLVRWYESHLDDMLRLPGVTAAQCFDFDTELSVEPDAAYKYLAVYDISTDDLGETLSAMQRAAGTPDMPMTDAMDPKTSAVVYRARGPRRTKAS